MKTYLKIALMLFIFIPFNQINAMYRQHDENPLKNLDYKNAFDQTAIYHKFSNLMREIGCADNVLGDEDESGCSCDILGLPVKSYRLIKRLFKRTTQKKEFECRCLEKLEDVRRETILKRAKDAALAGTISAASTAALTRWLVSPESFGGSFFISNAGMMVVDETRTVIESLFNLKQPHRHLDDLEKKYAVNKCFIPHQLWEKIEKNFEYARKGDDQQTAYTEFLEFALNFTTLKPQDHLDINGETIINTLFERMDTFLESYNITPWQCSMLKSNIQNFIENIIYNAGHSVRYLYLVGPGGIGKSEFVEQLQEWINELIPHLVYFSREIVDTPEGLEGDARHKGILLKTFGEQLAHHKRGSILLLDDAEWFGETAPPPLSSAAKRVFNGSLAEIKTTFLSQCDTDSGIKLPMPPMLVFVTSNNEIKDEALRDRFDIIHFPTNKKDALKRYGFELCLQESEYQKASSHIKRAIQNRLITEIESGKTLEGKLLTTFRKVKLHIAPLCFYMTHYEKHLKQD